MTLHRLAVTVKLATPRGRPRRQRSQVTGPAFYDAVMSTWLGPFTSEADAHSAEIRSRSRMRDCRVCMA
jgi:hypothetical protein